MRDYKKFSFKKGWLFNKKNFFILWRKYWGKNKSKCFK